MTTKQIEKAAQVKLDVNCIERLDLTNDAKAVLQCLVDGPTFIDTLVKVFRKGPDNAEAGARALVAQKLADVETVTAEVKGRMVERVKITARPIEAWENDRHFMAALRMRWV